MLRLDLRCLKDARTVSNHGPVRLGKNASLVAGLQIRLIKAREADMAVIRLKLGVDVLSAVLFVLKVLEALAVRNEVCLEFNDGLVNTDALIRGRDVDPVVLPEIIGVCRGDRLSIH